MKEPALQPLASEQVVLVKQSFRQLDTDRLAMRFYSSLFAEHPQVKSLFPDDLTILSTKIVSVFELIIHSFKENMPGEFTLQTEVLRPLRHLGELHTKKGVVNEYYPWANELLLKSIRDESQTFTLETEKAWKLALNHLTFAMLSDHLPSDHSGHETLRDSYQHLRSLLFKP